MSKKKGCGIIVLVVVIVIVVLGIIGAVVTPTTTTANVNSSNNTSTSSTQSSTNANKVVVLTSGNYIAGKDFPQGTYTIKAIKGYGNVSSSNMYEGGINEVMTANKTDEDEYAVTNYKNVKLPTGTTLSVSDVKIELIPSQN